MSAFHLSFSIQGKHYDMNFNEVEAKGEQTVNIGSKYYKMELAGSESEELGKVFREFLPLSKLPKIVPADLSERIVSAGGEEVQFSPQLLVELSKDGVDPALIRALIDKIAENILAFKKQKMEEAAKYCEVLRKILFENEGVALEEILQLINENEKRTFIIGQLFTIDDGIFNSRKQCFVELVRERWDEIIRDNEMYSSYLSDDLDRYEAYLSESRAQCFQRKSPMHGFLSSMDKSFLKYPLFLDEEIIGISRIIGESRLTDLTEPWVKKAVSENNKTVIQQGAIKACGGTCVTMLLLDQGLSPSMKEVYAGHLTTEEVLMRLIRKSGGTPIKTEIESPSGEAFLRELQSRLEKNGSAIIGVGGELGAHVLICDDISGDLQKVRVRDPWHGWEITLKTGAFLQRVFKEQVGLYQTKLLQLAIGNTS